MNLMVFVLDWSGFFTRSKKKKKKKKKKSSFDFNLEMNLMVGFSWGYTRTTMLINMLAIFKNCLLLWHLSIQEPNQSLNLGFCFHPLVALHCTGLQFKKNEFLFCPLPTRYYDVSWNHCIFNHLQILLELYLFCWTILQASSMFLNFWHYISSVALFFFLSIWASDLQPLHMVCVHWWSSPCILSIFKCLYPL